jgi:hypothetical protein
LGVAGQFEKLHGAAARKGKGYSSASDLAVVEDDLDELVVGLCGGLRVTGVDSPVTSGTVGPGSRET